MQCWACCRPRKAAVSPLEDPHTIIYIEVPPCTPSSTRVVENGLRRSPIISRSESSLVGTEEPGLVEQAAAGELAHSTPSLVQPEDIQTKPNLSRQVTPTSSVSSSIVSVDSQQLNGPQENNAEEDKNEEVKTEIKEETADIQTLNETEEEMMPKSSISISEEVNGNEIDETYTNTDNGVESPETKSLGTPSSEFGSESSKTTETSGNTIESNINAEDKPRRRIPRAISLKGRPNHSSKERPPLFPPTLPPFENPKDAFLKTLLQLENPEWEVVMQGLQGLVRLCRHHTKFLTASAHSVVTAIVHNIRNLRSQVSRGSCQASKEIFDTIGRFLDSEVEDLATALLSRTADTNKFLRGDALAALESMVDHTNPVRSIGILANKGLKHQNALVRCATSHLMLRLTKRLGPERCLSLPRESRDQLILAGAKLLTEGSLDTRVKHYLVQTPLGVYTTMPAKKKRKKSKYEAARKHAKEMFQLLSTDARLLSVMSEVVPNNVLRNISKVLSKIAVPNKQ